MGKISKTPANKVTFTPIQKVIFDLFAKEKNLTEKFYFTGGTALSAIYLHHRESEDLDFFSEKDFENEPVIEFINSLTSKIKAKLKVTIRERVRIFEFFSKDKLLIKVDFGYYPYPRLKKGTNLQNVSVDSLLDIGANKIMTIMQRTTIKDYVDLYFLLKKNTFWDLLNHSQRKFNMEIDIMLLASNFLRVTSFDYMPKMLVPLKLTELQDFYKDLAKKLGLRVTEK